MNSVTVENSEWFMRMLAPQSRSVKLDILSKLSASLAKHTRRSPSKDFFDGLTNAWDDDISAEEEVSRIYEARSSGETRKIVEF